MQPADYTIKKYDGEDRPKPYEEYLAYDNYILNRGKMVGRCTVCGQVALFEVNNTPQLREELDCPNCQSFNRIRQLVVALAYTYNVPVNNQLTLLSLFKAIGRSMRVLLLEDVTPIAAWFDYVSHSVTMELYKSEYLDGEMKSGEFKDGVMHLDIMDSGFPDNHFDLIIHADVFEHVSDAEAGEREQYRILKPGGHIVYTAPTYAKLEHDDIRTKLDTKGQLKKLKKAIYHGDPSPGTLGEAGSIVFRFFSYSDVRARYQAMGAIYECLHIYAPLFAIVGQENYVHVVRKPAPTGLLNARGKRKLLRHSS